MIFLNYIVFDLEFNQEYKQTEDKKCEENCPRFEIIQIGAVKLSENLEILSTFNSFVKPVIHKELHPYVENITKISMNDLCDAPEFTEVGKSFLDFIGGSQNIFCVWGFVDIKELINNLRYYDFSIDLLPNKYIDVQLQASMLFKLRKGMRIGLKPALENFQIESGDDFHNALADASYTAAIFKKIYKKEICPIKYKNSFL